MNEFTIVCSYIIFECSILSYKKNGIWKKNKWSCVGKFICVSVWRKFSIGWSCSSVLFMLEQFIRLVVVAGTLARREMNIYWLLFPDKLQRNGGVARPQIRRYGPGRVRCVTYKEFIVFPCAEIQISIFFFFTVGEKSRLNNFLLCGVKDFYYVNMKYSVRPWECHEWFVIRFSNRN